MSGISQSTAVVRNIALFRYGGMFRSRLRARANVRRSACQGWLSIALLCTHRVKLRNGYALPNGN